MNHKSSTVDRTASDLQTHVAVPAEARFALPVASVGTFEADGVRVFYRAAGGPS